MYNSNIYAAAETWPECIDENNTVVLYVSQSRPCAAANTLHIINSAPNDFTIYNRTSRAPVKLIVFTDTININKQLLLKVQFSSVQFSMIVYVRPILIAKQLSRTC